MEVNGQLQAVATLHREKAPVTLGPRAGLDAVEKRKITSSLREPNPGRTACGILLYRLSYPNGYCLNIYILIARSQYRLQTHNCVSRCAKDHPISRHMFMLYLCVAQN
jgi:hypothetical protein